MQKSAGFPVWPDGEWETVRLIGRGSYGAVYEIRRQLFGSEERAAMKVLSVPQTDGDAEELFSEGYDRESVTETFKDHMKSVVAEYYLMRELNGNTNVVNCDDIKYIQHDDGAGEGPHHRRASRKEGRTGSKSESVRAAGRTYSAGAAGTTGRNRRRKACGG